MLAKRMANFSGSATTAVTEKVVELRAAGKNIISLNVGEPDFNTPENIKQAGIQAVVDNQTRYGASNGLLDLRKEIVKKLKEDNGLSYTTEQICVTVGAKQALFNAFMAIADAGDEVIVPVPCWVSYTELIKLANAKPVLVPLDKEQGYALDLAAIEKAITPNTRAIVICTPNNPTGAVYSEKQLRKLAELAVKHDFYIIADEIYEKLIYEGEKHFSIGSISQEVWEHTITINGFSKAYAMTGWRLGYIAANDEVSGAIKKLQSQTTTSMPPMVQLAGLEALVGDQSFIPAMNAEFDKRRKYIIERLLAMPGITCPVPKGAFYALPNVSAHFGKKYKGQAIYNAIDFATLLLEAGQVATVPGEAFFIPGTIRMAYANSLENLATAMDRLEAFIKELE